MFSKCSRLCRVQYIEPVDQSSLELMQRLHIQLDDFPCSRCPMQRYHFVNNDDRLDCQQGILAERRRLPTKYKIKKKIHYFLEI